MAERQTEGSVADSLGKCLFNARLELIATLDRQGGEAESGKLEESASTYGDPEANDAVRRSLADLLQREVAAMNLDYFVVRPRRRLVEEYAKPESWVSLSAEALTELSHEVAGLPSEFGPGERGGQAVIAPRAAPAGATLSNFRIESRK